MNQIKIRVNKYRQQLNKREKQKYFSSVRGQLLKSYLEQIDQNNSMVIAKKSMQTNQLLQQIRNQHLLELLTVKIQNNFDKNNIMYIFVVCGNILLDDITIGQKQSVIKICLLAFKKCKAEYLREISFFDKMVHCFYVITASLKYLSDDDLQICQKVMFPFLINLFEIAFDFQINEQKPTADTALKFSICSDLILILQKYFNNQPEYKCEITSKMSRNFSIFKTIIDQHAYRLVSDKMLPLVMHVGMLELYEKFTTEIDIQKFPLIFQSYEFLNIIVVGIINGQPQQEGLCYKVMSNIFCRLEQYDYLTLNTFLEQQIVQKDKSKSFMDSLMRKQNKKEKIKIIKMLLCNYQDKPILKTFVNNYWQFLFDILFASLREDLCNNTNDSFYTIKIALEGIYVFIYHFIEIKNEPAIYFARMGGVAFINDLDRQIKQKYLMENQVFGEIQNLIHSIQFNIELQTL